MEAEHARFEAEPLGGRQMAEPSAGEVTRLLAAWSAGDPKAGEALTPLVYGELRRLARGYMARDRPD